MHNKQEAKIHILSAARDLISEPKFWSQNREREILFDTNIVQYSLSGALLSLIHI